MTNFKMLISAENINESPPCFSGRNLGTFPIRFNTRTEKNFLYCVLNASQHAYVSSVLNLDFLIVNYTNRLFLLLYENCVCST